MKKRLPKYPSWLCSNKVSFSGLDEGYQKYLLCKIGWTVDPKCRALKKNQKSELKIFKWICRYGAEDDAWVYSAFGFASAVAMSAQDNLMDFESSPSFYVFLSWVKKILWESMVKNKHLDDPSSLEEFNKALNWRNTLKF